MLVFTCISLGVGHSIRGSLIFGVLLTGMSLGGATIWSWSIHSRFGSADGIGAGLIFGIGLTSLFVLVGQRLGLPAWLGLLVLSLVATGVTKARSFWIAERRFDRPPPERLVCWLTVSLLALTPFVPLLLPASMALAIWSLLTLAWSNRPRLRGDLHLITIAAVMIVNRVWLGLTNRPPLWLATADQDIVFDESMGIGLARLGLDSVIGLQGEHVRGHLGLWPLQAAVSDIPWVEQFQFAGLAGAIALSFALVLIVHATVTFLGGTYLMGLVASAIAMITALPGYLPLFVFHNLRATNLYSVATFALGLLALRHYVQRGSRSAGVVVVLCLLFAILAKTHGGSLLIVGVALCLTISAARRRSVKPLLPLAGGIVVFALSWRLVLRGAVSSSALGLAQSGLQNIGLGGPETLTGLAVLGLKGGIVGLLASRSMAVEMKAVGSLLPIALSIWWILGGKLSSDYLIHYSFVAAAPLLVIAMMDSHYRPPRWTPPLLLLSGLGGLALSVIHLVLVGTTRYRPTEAAFARLALWRPESLALVTVAIGVLLGTLIHGSSNRVPSRLGVVLTIGLSISVGIGSFVGHASKPLVHGVLFERWDVNQPVLNESQLIVGSWLRMNAAADDILATNELCAEQLNAGESHKDKDGCSKAPVLWWLSALSQRQVLIEGPGFGPLALGAPYSSRQAEYQNASRAFSVDPSRGSARRLRDLGVVWFVSNSDHAGDGPPDDQIPIAFSSGPYAVIRLDSIRP